MFHLSTVEAETYSLLKTIFSIPEIKNNFALAGGTSLSLQLGHRKSIDLDIFSPNPFNTKETELLLASQPDLKVELVNSSTNMLFLYINNVKCDFIYEPSRLIFPFTENDGINYFHIADIAAMKMHTICGRGKKKDFFDVYVLVKNYGWQTMLEWFGKKYDASQFYFLWRSISYFADANEEPDVAAYEPYTKSWEEVKGFIRENCV